MESFYGGHAGVSFVLREAFPSRESMIKAFKQGRNYTDVWFGEYCVIATPNINDSENGEVYRRGVNYSAALGGAEYIGQFVGPQSGTPYFEVESLEQMQTEFTSEAAALFSSQGIYGADQVNSYPNDYEKRYHYIAKVSDKDATGYSGNSTTGTGIDTTKNDVISAYGDGEIGQITVIDKETKKHTVYDKYTSKDMDATLASGSESIMRKKDGDYVKPYVFEFTPSDGLVPGDQYDSIDISWFNVRTNSPESDSFIKVGVQIPYDVFNFDSYTVSPYDSQGRLKPAHVASSENKSGASLFSIFQTSAQQAALRKNPFYQQWTMENAKGIKGDSFHNFRIEKYQLLFSSKTQEANAKNWLVKTDTPQTMNAGQYTTVYDNEKIQTATANPESDTPLFYDPSTTKYEYDEIVDATQSGVYISKFTAAFNNKCYYSVDLDDFDPEKTKSEVISGQPAFNNDYNYIQDVEVLVADLYVYDQVQKPVPIPIFIGFVKQIKTITFNDTTGQLTITYSNGMKQVFVLKYVDSVAINTDDGQFTYNKLSGTETPDTFKGARLGWVKDLVLADDGKVYLSKTTNENPFNLTVDGKQITLQRAEYTGQTVRWIDEIIQNTDSQGTVIDDGIIDVQYNTLDDKGQHEHQEYYINYPKEISLATDIKASKRLNVTYTDPENGSTKKSGYIGDPINSIADSFVGEDWYLYILYTDPSRRPSWEVDQIYHELNSDSKEGAIYKTITIQQESDGTYRYVYSTKDDELIKGHNVTYSVPTDNSSDAYKTEYSKLPYIVNKSWCLDPVDSVASRTAGNDRADKFLKLEKWSKQKLFWQKIGPIRDDSGPYLGYHLTNERMHRKNNNYVISNEGIDMSQVGAELIIPGDKDWFTKDQVIEFLDKNFKNGLVSENLILDTKTVPPESKYEGKMIYYTPGEGTQASDADLVTAWIFAYDYSYYVGTDVASDWNEGGWSYLGALGSATDKPRCTVYFTESDYDSTKNNLETPGIGLYAQSKMQKGGWYDNTQANYHGVLTNIWDTANKTEAIYTYDKTIKIEDI